MNESDLSDLFVKYSSKLSISANLFKLEKTDIWIIVDGGGIGAYISGQDR